VYLLIAGTNTPVIVMLLCGPWRTWCLRMVWLIALTGVACLWLVPKAPHAVMVSLYLSLGWAGGVPVASYYRAVGWRAMNWTLLGALLYSAGAVCDLVRWPVIIPGWVESHEMLHLLHSAASFAFFVFIARYVIPYRRPPVQRRAAECAPLRVAAAHEQPVF